MRFDEAKLFQGPSKGISRSKIVRGTMLAQFVHILKPWSESKLDVRFHFYVQNNPALEITFNNVT